MTYAELVALIEDYLENEETTFVANIPVFVRLCEEDIYRSVQLPFLRKNNTALAFTASNQYLTLPTDYLSTYSFSVVVSSENIFLLPKDVNFMREAYPNSATTGTPRYYAQFSSTQFIVAPTPTSSYSVELNYYYKPETLLTASTNWLSQNGENALLFGSLYHGYVYMKGDQDIVTHYKTQYDKAITDLKLIAEGRNRKDTYRSPDSRIPT